MAVVKLSEAQACGELDKVLPTGEILSPNSSCGRLRGRLVPLKFVRHPGVISGGSEQRQNNNRPGTPYPCFSVLQRLIPTLC